MCLKMPLPLAEWEHLFCAVTVLLFCIPANAEEANGSWRYSLGPNPRANPRFEFSLTDSTGTVTVKLSSQCADPCLIALAQGVADTIVVNANGYGESEMYTAKLRRSDGPFVVVATTAHVGQSGAYTIYYSGPMGGWRRSDIRSSREGYRTLGYNAIRMAYYGDAEQIAAAATRPDPAIDDFLSAVVRLDYNYILAEFNFNRGATAGTGNATAANKLRDFRDAFRKTAEYGLRLIPLIQVGSRHSVHWRHLQLHGPYEQIGFSRVLAGEHNREGAVQTVELGVPSYSEEPEGMDRAFVDMMLALRDAHTESGVGYPLEFVHLGHDEPELTLSAVTESVLLIGEAAKTVRDCGVEKRGICRVLNTCASDVTALYGDTVQTENALQELIVGEVHRRVVQVRSAFGDDRIKVMIWADMWDEQNTGGKDILLRDGSTTVRTAPQILALPGLSSSQRNELRDGLILVAWRNGNNTVYPGGTKDMSPYDDGVFHAEYLFDQFRDAGLRFMYVHEATPDGSRDGNRLRQAREWYSSAKLPRFRGWYVGYGAVHWCGRWKAPPSCFSTMGYYYRLHRAGGQDREETQMSE